MFEGHQSPIMNTKQFIELRMTSRKMFHFAPYQAGPKKREFDKVKNDIMLEQKVIQQLEIETAEAIFVKPKKDKWVRLFVEYRCINVYKKRASYLIPRTEKCIGSLGEV